MRFPDFIEEMRAEANRRRLFVGVWSGYAMALTFLALAVVAHHYRAIPWSWTFYALVVIKLATNSAALVCLRVRRFDLEASGLNTLADLVLLTGAIYLTGGQASPLFSTYIIEISVVALLANASITALVAGVAFALYAAMALLVQQGALASLPAPVQVTSGLTSTYVGVDLLFSGFLIAVVTYYAGSILRALRARERALEARTSELVEANKLKSQFTANVTHELRTPIHGVLGLTELIEEEIYGPVSARQREALRGIRDSAGALLHQIDDLLELARAETGRLELRRSRFAVADVVERVVSVARWMQGTKELSIEVSVAADIPELDSDRGKLVQVLINLVSNAIKFTPDGGRVRVEAWSPDPGRVAIAVADTGVGIPDAERAHVFDAFRQVDGSSSRDYGGVGLGLSLADRLVKLLGGRIHVDSQVGRGSRFEIALPTGPPC